MKHIVGLLAFLLLFAVGGVCAYGAATNDAPPSAWLLDGVAAQVGSETITISDVMNEIRNSAWIEMSKEDREKSLRKLYSETLDAFINRRLILAAAKAAELKLQPWVINDRVQEIIDNRYKGNRALLLSELTDHHVNYDEWKKGIEEEMMLMAMRSENVDKLVTVSPREVRSFYETNRQALATAPSVHIGRIMMMEKSGTEGTLAQIGEQALKELDAGADFAAVVRKYTCDSDEVAAKGGDKGWVDLDDLAPSLVKALSELKPGQFSRMQVLGNRGYILKKIEERGASQPTLDEAWTQVERRLRIQKSEAFYREWTGRLRRNGFVKIFDLPPTPMDR